MKNEIRARLRLTAGELVEIRSKEEILSTLDKNACLDGMPFMPEMFQYCGMQFRVFKRAHKTCDTVFPVRGRRMANAVHLETRCNGAAHGGCQAACLIFWKESWLKRVDNKAVNASSARRLPVLRSGSLDASQACSEACVWQAASSSTPDNRELTFSCQATKLPYATTELNWWDIRQYLEDYSSGNVTLITIVKAALHSALFQIRRRLPKGGWRVPEVYDRTLAKWTGAPWPTRRGPIEPGKSTPTQVLDLQPGELVRVKPYEQILQTLNRQGRNRGMSFDKEMVPFCGGEFRVLKRVTNIIDEKTGKMMDMKNQCIILDDVYCQSRYSECRLFCPRSIYSYWREIWLERIPQPEASATCQATSAECGVPNKVWQLNPEIIGDQSREPQEVR